MKLKFFPILLAGFSIFLLNCKSSKQNIDISKIEAVVELGNMNVVYRGFANPIKISIPNAVSISAEGEGLTKNTFNDGYTLNVGTGDKVEILVRGIMPNGENIERIKILRIRDVSRPEGQINKRGCYKCIIELTKEELTNGKIEVKFVDFMFDINNDIVNFKIKFPENPTIKIKGNLLNKKAKDLIDSLNLDDMVYVFDISPRLDGHFASFKMKKVSPIKIKIVE